MTATYTLSGGNALVMEFAGTNATAASPFNVVNHAYYNLSGGCASPITEHVLTLPCSRHVAVDSFLIPTGIAAVAGGPMDFTTPTVIGKRIAAVDGGGETGYDHCWLRDGWSAGASGVIAVLEHTASGRKMTVETDQPGVQFYSGNFLSKNKGDAPHVQHNALCLETGGLPDAINQPAFPPTMVAPGQDWSARTVHTFTW